MGNKLFAIGGYHAFSSEVFDSLSRKFTLLSFSRRSFYYTITLAVSIGFYIVVFSVRKNGTRIYIYDVINDYCFNIDVEDLKNLFDYSVVKCSTC